HGRLHAPAANYRSPDAQGLQRRGHSEDSRRKPLARNGASRARQQGNASDATWGGLKMGRVALALVAAEACAVCGLFLAGAMRADDLAARAKKLHFSSLIIDTHDDTTQRLLDAQFDLGTQNELGSIDIPRMRSGNLGGIFFSIWIPSK